jgi:hypothetical protein
MPVFTSVKASSEKEQMGETTYEADRVVDGNMLTAWAEGQEGSGIGSYIELKADTPQRVSKVSLINGYTKSQAKYNENNRVKTITITGENGLYLKAPLEDNQVWLQDILLRKPTTITKWLRITISDIYTGSVDPDGTLISEIVIR